jgi:hypothetical protein
LRDVPIVGDVLPDVTAKATPFDTPPPGFVTVISSHPTEATSATLIKAVNCVALTNVVNRLLPLKFTVAPLTKPMPFTVRVNVSPPAVADAGETVVIAGD